MCVCVCVRARARARARVRVCVCVPKFITPSTHTHTHTHLYTHTRERKREREGRRERDSLALYVCVYVCVYVCECVRGLVCVECLFLRHRGPVPYGTNQRAPKWRPTRTPPRNPPSRIPRRPEALCKALMPGSISGPKCFQALSRPILWGRPRPSPPVLTSPTIFTYSGSLTPTLFQREFTPV